MYFWYRVGVDGINLSYERGSTLVFTKEGHDTCSVKEGSVLNLLYCGFLRGQGRQTLR